ncbi:MAG: hypothetical protein KGV57_01200, partial [Fusobacterium sp.]|nr:hypothetical protein [Fusobacterium sp.]
MSNENKETFSLTWTKFILGLVFTLVSAFIGYDQRMNNLLDKKVDKEDYNNHRMMRNSWNDERFKSINDNLKDM